MQRGRRRTYIHASEPFTADEDDHIYENECIGSISMGLRMAAAGAPLKCTGTFLFFVCADYTIDLHLDAFFFAAIPRTEVILLSVNKLIKKVTQKTIVNNTCYLVWDSESYY